MLVALLAAIATMIIAARFPTTKAGVVTDVTPHWKPELIELSYASGAGAGAGAGAGVDTGVATGVGTDTAPLFDSVTATGVDVVVLPAASRATAVRVCVPFGVDSVYQEIWYGGVVTSLPRLRPLTLNWTPTTPVSSAAVAVSSTAEPETTAPFAGAVRLTVGAVVSAFVIATEL